MPLYINFKHFLQAETLVLNFNHISVNNPWLVIKALIFLSYYCGLTRKIYTIDLFTWILSIRELFG